MGERIVTDYCVIHKGLFRGPLVEDLVIWANRNQLPWEQAKVVGWQSYEYKKIDPKGFFEPALTLATSVLPAPGKHFRLIRLRPGIVIPTHVDSGSKDIHSVNVLLRPPNIGGVLKINFKEIYLQTGDAVVYCATKQKHSMSPPIEGTALLLSIQTEGWG